MKWKELAINKLKDEMKANPELFEVYEKVNFQKSIGVHLAIFVEPYLDLVKKGKKSIESRFSVNRIAPYDKINVGDVVLVKKSGGLVCGFFTVKDVEFFSNLNSKSCLEIENNYGEEICTYVDENFWDNRIKSRYASIIMIDKFHHIEPFSIVKKDRLGWSVLKESTKQKQYDYEEYFVLDYN
jgi:ASC-1-like (ASCH) protein